MDAHRHPRRRPNPVSPFTAAAAEAAEAAEAAAPFMTVTSSGAGPEDGAGKLELRNPDGVSEAAIEDGLNLYHRIMACEDPKLKGALESAIQVLYTVVLQQYSCYTALLGVVPGLLSRCRPLCRNFNFVCTCVFHERSRGDGQRSNRATACRVDSLSKCTRVSTSVINTTLLLL